jgi:hypothetical protein
MQTKEEYWEGMYNKLKNESDRRIRGLIDEAERNLGTILHLYAVNDRLRWALTLCRGKMPPEDWDEDIDRFSESL